VGITTGSQANTVQFNITIRNGTIQGMGGGGTFLQGDSHLVEYTHVRSDGSGGFVGIGGIRIEQSQDLGSSIVQHSTVQRNAGIGISVSSGAARYNVADVNRFDGIFVFSGSASYNVVTRNTRGINLGVSASAFGNTAVDNFAGNLTGANLGQNHCTGTGGPC